MRIRSFILPLLLVGAFVYLVSFSNVHSVAKLPLAQWWNKSPLQLMVADAQPRLHDG